MVRVDDGFGDPDADPHKTDWLYWVEPIKCEACDGRWAQACAVRAERSNVAMVATRGDRRLVEEE
jgi:hypothetical protein